MHIKSYTAPTLAAALKLARDELGPDALVLGTRQVRRDGGVFGLLGRAQVEVTAAVDRDRRALPEGEPAARPDASWKALSITRSLLDPIEVELRELRRAVDGLADPGGTAALARDVSDLRRAVFRLVEERESGAASAAAALEGVAPRHAAPLAALAARRPGTHALRDALAARLDERLLVPRDDAPPGVSLFVGAAGVGKTTTVAKLAARDPDGVALVTTDVHRVGAIEALRAFSERHGIPFSSAATPAQLGRFLEATPGRRVLVDTAGRSRGDRAAFAELARARGIAGRRGDVQLVVSATTQEGDLRDEVARFADLEPAALVVTKVDDTRSLAGLANLLLDEVAPPLAWLGVGQRVPDDLALAEPVSLADRVLGAAP